VPGEGRRAAGLGGGHPTGSPGNAQGGLARSNVGDDPPCLNRSGLGDRA